MGLDQAISCLGGGLVNSQSFLVPQCDMSSCTLVPFLKPCRISQLLLIHSKSQYGQQHHAQIAMEGDEFKS